MSPYSTTCVPAETLTDEITSFQALPTQLELALVHIELPP
jgi:hypothetical protein